MGKSKEALPLRYFSNVTAREVDWLWYPYIPFGKITLIQGDPGDGKTTLALNIAAILSNGSPMLDSDKKVDCTKIIYQSAEDSLAEEGRSIAFEINENSKVRWIGEYDITADELLRGYESQSENNKLIEAIDSLRTILSDKEVPCVQIYATLQELGISKRSVDRAKKILEIKSIKRTNGWYWSLKKKRAWKRNKR